jgi:hypothetical protein
VQTVQGVCTILYSCDLVEASFPEDRWRFFSVSGSVSAPCARVGLPCADVYTASLSLRGSML